MPVGLRKPKRLRISDIRLDPITISGYENRTQQEKIERMIESLKEKGQLEPIIANEDLTIIWRGHTRYFAAKRLKWRFIKAIIMNNTEWNDYILSNRALV